MHAYAETAAPAVMDGLEVSLLGAFCALTPAGGDAAVNALASDIVRHFEPFRAPPGEAARARRLRSPLTDRQRTYLDRFGYPYVHEEFRFHVTLTGLDSASATACGALRLAPRRPLNQAGCR
jgi:hypothetical protein